MPKNEDDKIKELLEWKQEHEKLEAVQKATQGYIMLRCTTVFVTIWATLVAIGAWCSEHFKGLEAAIKAYIAMEYRK